MVLLRAAALGQPIQCRLIHSLQLDSMVCNRLDQAMDQMVGHMQILEEAIRHNRRGTSIHRIVPCRINMPGSLRTSPIRILVTRRIILRSMDLRPAITRMRIMVLVPAPTSQACQQLVGLSHLDTLPGTISHKHHQDVTPEPCSQHTVSPAMKILDSRRMLILVRQRPLSILEIREIHDRWQVRSRSTLAVQRITVTHVKLTLVVPMERRLRMSTVAVAEDVSTTMIALMAPGLIGLHQLSSLPTAGQIQDINSLGNQPMSHNGIGEHLHRPMIEEEIAGAVIKPNTR